MLKIEGLVKRYGKFTAVDHLNMYVKKGSIFGFVGPNGAGKTTTMKIMAGLMSANEGEVYIDGINVSDDTDLLKQKIGYMPDFFGVYNDLRVDEYLDFYAGTYFIPYDQRKEIIDNLLELVDLSNKREAYVDSLSRGMKQRLCLARSLVHDPDVLILDEPASGLDPRARVEMKEVLKQLSTMDKTIIISSHILPELAEMCTEIGIINHGKMIDSGSVTEIMGHLQKEKIVEIKALSDITVLKSILEQMPNVGEITENTFDVEFKYKGDDNGLVYILKELVASGVQVLSFREKEGNLEDIFMELTGGDEDDA
jgi:ABC-2 type transport system ATP-binding protein